jgi:hypothetical protein
MNLSDADFVRFRQEAWESFSQSIMMGNGLMSRQIRPTDPEYRNYRTVFMAGYSSRDMVEGIRDQAFYKTH